MKLKNVEKKRLLWQIKSLLRNDECLQLANKKKDIGD
jgi:hypothetical protein